MTDINAGKIYQSKDGMRRKVRSVNGRSRRSVVFEELAIDGIGTGKSSFVGYREFCRWAIQEVP